MIDDQDPSSASQRVVAAVADERGVDPTELEPLYRVVDPDCLDDIFRVDESTPGWDANHVAFAYGGCDVRVASDGSVTVTRIEDDVSPTKNPGSAGSSDQSASPD